MRRIYRLVRKGSEKMKNREKKTKVNLREIKPNEWSEGKQIYYRREKVFKFRREREAIQVKTPFVLFPEFHTNKVRQGSVEFET
jgi:hypothetical protein